MSGAYLGPAYGENIRQRLPAEGAHFEVLNDETALLDRTAPALAEGRAVGWFQGGMEYGPRALGNRVHPGRPANPEMQKTLNLKVKYRESFRPFAPAVLAEDAPDWFELDRPSHTCCWSPTSATPSRRTNGAEHHDGSTSSKPSARTSRRSRMSTIPPGSRPCIAKPIPVHALMRAFKPKPAAGPGQHDFNVRGEPIACSPEDAFRCLMGTEIEMLVIENCVLYKDRRGNPALILDYRNAFDPD